MRPMIAGIVFVLVILIGAQPATAQVIVTIDPSLLPPSASIPFAHAWVETNRAFNPNTDICGGGRGSTGSATTPANCPLMTSTDPPIGDQATASSSANPPPPAGNGQLSASANAFKTGDPTAYAAAAAYAKLGTTVQTAGRNVGGAYSITHGGLTVEGSSEPVDTVYVLVVSNLGPKEIPKEFQRIFTQAVQDKLPPGFNFVPITEEYLRLEIVLDGKTKKIRPLTKGGNECPKNVEQAEITQPCLQDLQPITENDFMELCPGKHPDCAKQLKKKDNKSFIDNERTVQSQKKEFKAKVWFPPAKDEKTGRPVSVDSILCTQVTGTKTGGPVKPDKLKCNSLSLRAR